VIGDNEHSFLAWVAFSIGGAAGVCCWDQVMEAVLSPGTATRTKNVREGNAKVGVFGIYNNNNGSFGRIKINAALGRLLEREGKTWHSRPSSQLPPSSNQANDDPRALAINSLIADYFKSCSSQVDTPHARETLLKCFQNAGGSLFFVQARSKGFFMLTADAERDDGFGIIKVFFSLLHTYTIHTD